MENNFKILEEPKEEKKELKKEIDKKEQTKLPEWSIEPPLEIKRTNTK